MTPDPELWHRQKGKTQGSTVCAIADALWDDQQANRRRLLDSASWYEGHRLESLDAEAYQTSVTLRDKGNYNQVYWNVPRALVQSLTAKCAGRQRPKPQFVCTDTDWTTKRRAKRLERFAEATMYQPQGQYRDAWDLGIRMFVDACVWGMGVLKVYADTEGKRIGIDRILPWELLVDPTEAERGAPLNIFHRYRYDKDRLIARFPKFRAEILAAKDDEKRVTGKRGRLRSSRQCVVREAWRLPIGEDDKGVHCIAIDGTVLLTEEWDRDEFPFLILRYSSHLLGFGASSLVEEAIPTAEELNFTIERMREGERKLAAGCVIYQEGTVEDSALADNKIGALVPYSAQATAPPSVLQPQGFSDSTMQWMRLHWEKCFELTGVSQMGATSKKEPGVTAGVALRTIAQMETERFSVIYGAYEQTLAVDLARHSIACARQVSAVHKDFAVRWPGGRFMQEIDWSKADLEDDKYYIQGHAVAGIVNTPADRLQLGQDLFNAGTIGQDAFLRITQLKDVDGELRVKNVQHEVVEQYIESWLEADPEDEEAGTFRYRAPVPFMNHADAIVQVATAYMQAELDRAPDWNLQFFTQFITQCDGEISKAEAAKRAANAPPPAPAMPLPGAPGGAPMPPPGGGPAQMLN